MSETDTTTGTTHYRIVARVSPGLVIRPLEPQARLKGTNEEREPQGKWTRKLGEAPEKYMYFHLEAEGVARRADPKE